MIKLRYFLMGLIVLANSGGCTSPPPYALPNSGVTVKRVLDTVTCEVYKVRDEISRRNPDWLKRGSTNSSQAWAAVVDLTLQVDDSLGAQPTLAYMNPLHAAGTSFVFNVGGNFSQARQRIFTERITYALDQLDPINLPAEKSEACRLAYSGEINIAGDLGIAETGMLALNSVDPNSKEIKRITAFGSTIKFVVSLGFNSTGPTWTFTHWQQYPGKLASGKRDDTHQIVISFAQPKQPGGGNMVATTAIRAMQAIQNNGAQDAALQNNYNMILQQIVKPQ